MPQCLSPRGLLLAGHPGVLGTRAGCWGAVGAPSLPAEQLEVPVASGVFQAGLILPGSPAGALELSCELLLPPSHTWEHL